jgi:hypothetical protein
MKQETVEFNIQDILPIALVIVVTVIALSYGLQVMGDVRSDMTVDTAEYNATAAGITAVAKFPTKMGLLVTVIIAAIVIGVLIRYLAPRVMGGR